MLVLFIRLIAIALVAYLIYSGWRILNPRYTLKIVIGNQGIKHHEGLSKDIETRVLKHFEKHRSFDGDVTILVTRQSDGDLRLEFKGQVDQDTREQVRDFLMTVM